MSDAYYQNLRDVTAGPLIEKYGMPISLIRHTPGVVDNDAGTIAAGTDATYPCFGLVNLYDARVHAASLVAAGEKEVLVSAKGLNVVPQVGDKFNMPDGIWFISDGNDYNRIPPVQTLAPGGIAIMYTIRIRQ
jgi:hypothetical protein